MLPKGSIGKIFDYYFNNPEYEGEIMRAFREFFELPNLQRGGSLDLHPTSEGLFNEWFLYDFLLSNKKTPFENFVEENPLGFSPSKMKLYKDILKSNEYGMYEAIIVNVGTGLTVHNIQTREQFFVNEKSLTRYVVAGDCFFARAAYFDYHYEFIGADTFRLNFSVEDKKILRESIMDFKITPQFVNKVLMDKQLHHEWESIIRETIKKNL